MSIDLDLLAELSTGIMPEADRERHRSHAYWYARRAMEGDYRAAIPFGPDEDGAVVCHWPDQHTVDAERWAVDLLGNPDLLPAVIAQLGDEDRSYVEKSAPMYWHYHVTGEFEGAEETP